MMRVKGHYCSVAKAITPLYDGMCDWCDQYPDPEYVWVEGTVSTSPSHWEDL